MTTQIRMRILLVLTVCAILPCIWILGSTLASPEELTRIRNSLIAKMGSAQDFDWKPGSPPAGFLYERAAPPFEFLDIADGLNVQDDGSVAGRTELSLEIARHLAQGPGIGEGIQSNSLDTYRTIMAEERGYCADYTQVFNAIALAAEIPVREWGMSFDGFSGEGHAFNEIFDEDFDKWVFIDSFYSFYVIDRQTGHPMSVVELHEALAEGRDESSLEVRKILPERFGFRGSSMALDYYRAGLGQYYLWFGNNVFSYEIDPVVRRLGAFSRALEQASAIVSGLHPTIRVLPTKTNRGLIDELHSRGWLFFASAGALLILVLALILELRTLRRVTRRQKINIS